MNRGGGRNSQHFVCSAAKIVENFNSLNQPKVKAFTLAEVLITLVIIGIVSALTIPSVVTSYQKHQTVTKLKKTFMVLSQTTNMAIKDHGPMKNWQARKGETKQFVTKYITPYLSIAKDCEYGTTGDCEFKLASLNNQSNKKTVPQSYYKIILNDGSAVFFAIEEDTYTHTNGVKVPRTYVFTYIDVNGRKPPNVKGKDIFKFLYWIKNDHSDAGSINYPARFTPDCAGGDRNVIRSGGCNKDESGNNCCAALIMIDGWQMKDDYPW